MSDNWKIQFFKVEATRCYFNINNMVTNNCGLV